MNSKQTKLKSIFKFEDIYPHISFLEALRDKKILVTGGTGYLGKCLLDYLVTANTALDLNLTLNILSRDPTAFQTDFKLIKNIQKINFYQVDFTNQFHLPILQDIIKEIDYIIHGATPSTKIQDLLLLKESPQIFLESILNGTKLILDLVKLNPDIRCLYVSSGAVYRGINNKSHFSEEDWKHTMPIIKDNGVYILGKRLSEKYFYDYFDNDIYKKFSIARCFSFIGPYLPLGTELAVSNFFTSLMHNKPISINSDGSEIRSFMHSYDLAIWIIKILMEGKNGEVYNVGSDEAITIKDFAEKISHMFNQHPIVINKDSNTNNAANRAYIPDLSKTRRELNLSLNFNLDRAISDSIEWYGL